MKKQAVHRDKRFLWHYLMAAVAAAAVVFSVHPVLAEGTEVDENAQGSIVLNIDRDEWYVEGTSFRLYQVASISSDLTFTKTADFAQSSIDIEPESLTGELEATASKWMDASKSLIQWVQDHNIKEDALQQMRNRSCTFAGLNPGLYLIQGDTGKEGNRTVTYQPVLICIPQRSDVSNDWNYHITANVKSADPTYTAVTPSPESSPVPELTPVPSSTPGTTTWLQEVLPNTGDAMHVMEYALITVIAVLIAVYAVMRLKKGEQ